jgi:phosphate transport system permease protein
MAASADQPQTLAAGEAATLRAMVQSWHLGDRIFKFITQAAAVAVIAVSLALLAVLVWQAWLAITTIGAKFFTTITWDPEPTHREFGALAFIYGTVATSVIAMVIAVPLGVGTAVFLSEIAPPWLRRTGSFLVELLAAIPSVVYGFWGLFVLAPLMQTFITALGGPNQGGVGILSAGVILSIMIVPYIAAVSFDVCQAVPNSQREGSYALGSTRWQTIWKVVLPYAKPGIIGGCFLALGRALGETMAVTMLIGNKTEINFSPFAMGNSIPSVIANEFTEATYDLYLSALVELGLALLVVSIVVNSFARFLIWRVGQTGRKMGFFTSLLLFFRPRQRAAAIKESSGVSPLAEEPSEKPAFEAVPPPASEVPHRPGRKHRLPKMINYLMTGVLGVSLVITIGFLLLILGYLLVRGIGALITPEGDFNWAFFTNLPAPVGETGGGMANALFGSFVLVSLASAFAVPIGILAAVYLAEYRSERIGPTVRFIGELLAGVPSIVIGIFAYYLVVKPMGHFSGWAGSFALGVMMLPIVMRATEEALRIVPTTLRHASYALGASQWQTVVKVTLPAALPAIITAVFLGIARVVGETAPLILTAFNNSHWPASPNDAMPSLPYFIFNYAVSPYEDWHQQAWAAALVLIAVVMILSFGVRLIMGRRAISTRQAG